MKDASPIKKPGGIITRAAFWFTFTFYCTFFISSNGAITARMQYQINDQIAVDEGMKDAIAKALMFGALAAILRGFYQFNKVEGYKNQLAGQPVSESELDKQKARRYNIFKAIIVTLMLGSVAVTIVSVYT